MPVFRFIAILLLALSALHGHAAAGDELIARLQPDGPVNDYADILSASSESKLESLLTDLERKTDAAVVVVTLDSMQGGQIDDFTNRLYEEWGVGQAGEDAGVMLLVALAERKMRIEVGYGLESVIPDGLAGQIRDDYVLAYFKRGEMQTGVVQGALAIADRLADHYGVDLSERPAAAPGSSRGESGPAEIFIILIFIFIIATTFVRSFTRDGRRRRGLFGGGYGGYHGGSFRSGGFGGGGGGGFGGFGGGMSGGGGASGGW